MQIITTNFGKYRITDNGNRNVTLLNTETQRAWTLHPEEVDYIFGDDPTMSHEEACAEIEADHEEENILAGVVRGMAA